jgi:hypothetical protein
MTLSLVVSDLPKPAKGQCIHQSEQAKARHSRAGQMRRRSAQCPHGVGGSSRCGRLQHSLGIQPDTLYQAYQVFADQPAKLEICALTVGQKCSFAIEAFNERGVSKLSEVVRIE